MNRVIKFRGKCIQSGDWTTGDLIHGVGHKKGRVFILPVMTNLAYVKHCDPLDGVEVIPETVGQFTGIFDKNGVEIYEGDWLSVSQGYSSKIEFMDGMFVSVYYHQEDGETLPICDITPNKCEVIGNIHDNG